LAAGLLGVAGCCGIDDRAPLPIFSRDVSSELPAFPLVATVASDEPAAAAPVAPAAPVTPAGGHVVLASCFGGERAVDLAAVLSLAGGGNPTIALGEEFVQQNLAEQMLARSLLFPTLNAGTTLSAHRGALQGGSGTILDANRESFYYGGGADVRG